MDAHSHGRRRPRVERPRPRTPIRSRSTWRSTRALTSRSSKAHRVRPISQASRSSARRSWAWCASGCGLLRREGRAAARGAAPRVRPARRAREGRGACRSSATRTVLRSRAVIVTSRGGEDRARCLAVGLRAGAEAGAEWGFGPVRPWPRSSECSKGPGGIDIDYVALVDEGTSRFSRDQGVALEDEGVPE